MIAVEDGEIRDVRAVAADFFAKHRVALDDDDTPRYDRAVWSRACTDLGVAAILEPESDGGIGGGAAMAAAVLVEAGRTLSPLPLLSSAVLAQTALRLVADAGERSALIGDLLSGASVATLAPWDVSMHAVSARRDGGRWTLTGSVGRVLDGVGADLVLVLAPVSGGVGLFALDADTPREPQRAIDLTRSFARISCDGAPTRLLGTADAEVLSELGRWRALALAADQVGGAEACLALTVEYLRTRIQFGRAIGSFQALKHQCAELAMRLDEARSALAYLIWAIDESPEDAAEAAAMATVVASSAYVTCADETVHLHGGIGFTWEHDAHRYVRRALTDRSAFHNLSSARESILAARGL